MEFAISISCFKTDLERIDANCKNNETIGCCSIDTGIDVDDSLEYTSWNIPYGYPKNAKCEYTLVIEPDTEVLLEPYFSLESADRLTYYEFDGFKNISNILISPLTTDYNHVYSVSTRFFPNDDGSPKEIYIEFLSDANIQTGNSEIRFFKTGLFS